MMNNDPNTANAGQFEDCRAVSLPSSDPPPLRVCVMVRNMTDPAEGSFYLLRDLPDARVYLGCVIDVCGQIRDWLELWLQNVDGLDGSLAAWREHFNNSFLDERWERQCEALRELSPKAILSTGWESRHPYPTFIDMSSGAMFHPETPAPGGRYELCRDDALLKSAGLPAFSTSLFRYLYQPALGGESRFIPVVSGAPENAKTSPLAAILGDRRTIVPWNAQGGLMMASILHPLGIQDYIDILGGKPWGGASLGPKPFKLGSVYPSLEEKEYSKCLGSHFFLGAHGWTGRFLEAFHLKLQLLLTATCQVQSYIGKNQLPLLNLSHESFRVKLGELDPGFPLLWTAKCALVKPGQAQKLPVKTTDESYFIRLGAPSPSMYQPEGRDYPLQGAGTVRIRKILPLEHEGIVIEGTLVPPEPQPVSPRDLLWIRLPLSVSRLDLYGHAYAAEGLAKGEIRFRTLPQKLSDSTVAALRSAEGVPFANCAFEVVPLLSSPCDLYALGVLAVRTLLVNDQTSLAIALDEILSLARQVGLDTRSDSPISLPSRIRSLFEKDPRWLASLGPHRLMHREIAPESAIQLLPSELWMETLANIVRLFPGAGPDSQCRDLGDAHAQALEAIFTPSLITWENLLARSRSLIVIDLNFNGEIRAAIDQFLH